MLTLVNLVQQYMNINMKTKLKELFSSIRFWIVTLTAITGVLGAIADGNGLAEIIDVVQYYFIAVAGIGTADSIASKIGNKN